MDDDRNIEVEESIDTHVYRTTPRADPPTEDALRIELLSLREQHSALLELINSKSRALRLLTHRGSDTMPERPVWGPCTRCEYTWSGNWPFTPPRACPRCGSSGWRVPPSRANSRRPSDPPNPRWSMGRAEKTSPIVSSAPKLKTGENIAPFIPPATNYGNSNPGALIPPPPAPRVPSLVPSQNVRFADNAGMDEPQPERSAAPQKPAPINNEELATMDGEETRDQN
jgi:hypothetical protein